MAWSYPPQVFMTNRIPDILKPHTGHLPAFVAWTDKFLANHQVVNLVWTGSNQLGKLRKCQRRNLHALYVSILTILMFTWEPESITTSSYDQATDCLRRMFWWSLLRRNVQTNTGPHWSLDRQLTQYSIQKFAYFWISLWRLSLMYDGVVKHRYY